MIASLPMYYRAEVAPAHDRFWALIRAQLSVIGIDCPAELSVGDDESAAWTDPGLVLSQTCGMPYRNGLHGHVTLVGTPDYDLEGCEPGWGRSAFVVRNDDDRSTVSDFSDAVFAYNQGHSQSGFSAPYHHVAELGFWFERRHHAGQHLASARAVADGTADIAAIDVVTLRLIERYEPFVDKLTVIDHTPPNPGLPFITSSAHPQPVVFAAVMLAIEGLSDDDRDTLGLEGIVEIPAETYLAVPNPPASVVAGL